ncbi:MAG TPA: XrtA system polysaccharide chain length determinant [Rhizomicrobium sp.]|nr:XrtA system polysaccharide chain length determinant [Rhizomicrobium sp.]
MASLNVPPQNLKKLVLEEAIVIWKQRWLALLAAWILCLAGWTGVMLVPQRFESNARAFIDVNGLLTPLLRGLIVNTTPAGSEDYLRQTLLSRPNLEQVIVLANLGGNSLGNVQRGQLVDQLSHDIKVTTEGENLVSIAYASENPLVARNVVDALLTVFAEKAATSSRAEMDKARAFLSAQIGLYQNQLRTAEKRRAAFRKKYADFFVDSAVARPEILQQQVKQIRQQYEDALTTRAALAAELKTVPALLNVASAPTVTDSGQLVAASPEVRLAQAQRNLADLKLIYTDKHPDVLAAQRSVSELQAELKAKPKTTEGKTQISNPTYEQLRLKLVDVETTIPTLKSRLDKATEDYNRVKSLSGELPDVEAKSRDLDRDYAIIKQNYDELVKRREAANLSQAADDRADRTQFRIVDPPLVPISPSFPNRILLFSIATLVGLAAGIALPLGLARIHPVYGSTARLEEFGLPVIGAVTYAPRARSTDLMQRISGGLFATGTVCLLLAYMGILLVTNARYMGLR